MYSDLALTSRVSFQMNEGWNVVNPGSYDFPSACGDTNMKKMCLGRGVGGVMLVKWPDIGDQSQNATVDWGWLRLYI